MLEQTIVNDYNSIWLIIFIFLIILVIVIGIVIRGKSSDKKDTIIFAKSSDNAKDVTIHVTDNMEKMHEDVTKVQFTEKHEHEFHRLEVGLEEVSEKLSILTERVVKLELERNKQKQQEQQEQ